MAKRKQKGYDKQGAASLDAQVFGILAWFRFGVILHEPKISSLQFSSYAVISTLRMLYSTKEKILSS